MTDYKKEDYIRVAILVTLLGGAVYIGAQVVNPGEEPYLSFDNTSMFLQSKQVGDYSYDMLMPDGSFVFNHQVMNAINDKNELTDCNDPYICDYKLRITAGQNIILDLKQIGGDVMETSNGQISVDSIFIEGIDTLSDIKMDNGSYVDLIIRFRRSNPQAAGDIYHVIYGNEFKDAAWWTAYTVEPPAISYSGQSFCDNFGDGGSCDHGTNANWVQIATGEEATAWTCAIAGTCGNDTTTYREGTQSKKVWSNSTQNSQTYITFPTTMDLRGMATWSFWTMVNDTSGNGKTNVWISNGTAWLTTACFANINTSTYPAANTWRYTTCSLPASHRQITSILYGCYADAGYTLNCTFDDARAVGTNGQFYDSANAITRWVTNGNTYEIQNVSGSNMLRGIGTSNNKVLCYNQVLNENLTVRWKTRAIGAAYTPVFFFKTGAVSTSYPRDNVYVSLDTLKLDANGTTVASTAFDVTTGVEYNMSYSSNGGTTTACISSTCVSAANTNRNNGYFCMLTNTNDVVDMGEVLIQSHIPPAINTTDNSGIFSCNQALECSTLTNESHGETVCDWYQNGVINQTAKRMVAYYSFPAKYSNSTFTPDMSIVQTANGTVSGATWTPNGKIGGAYNFNGTSATTIATGVNISGTSYTVLAWINVKSLSVNNAVLGQDTGAGARSYFLRATSGGVIRFYVFGSIAAGQSEIAMPAANEWVFVGGRYNITDNSVTVIKNGALYAPATITGTPITPTTNLTVGTASGVYFNGSIDEVRIYNTALSANEINEIYQNGTLGKTMLGPSASPSKVNASFVTLMGSQSTQNITSNTNTDFTVNYNITPIRAICLNDSILRPFFKENATRSLIYAENPVASYSLNLYIFKNSSTPNFDIWLNTVYDSGTATKLTTSSQKIKTNWPANTLLQIWAWVNCSTIFSNDTMPALNFTSEVYSCE